MGLGDPRYSRSGDFLKTCSQLKPRQEGHTEVPTPGLTGVTALGGSAGSESGEELVTAQSPGCRRMPGPGETRGAWLRATSGSCG